MRKSQLSFWITNCSKLNVSLADLGITVKSMTSVNLLDEKHYTFTLPQLMKSLHEGSIFKKRDKIKLREKPPVQIKNQIQVNKNTFIDSRTKSIVEIEYKKYEELVTDDDKYGEDIADLADHV